MHREWSIMESWNKALASRRFEPYKRDYFYASEIGGSFFDVYHSMMGVEATNPSNDRSLRTMEAGNFHEDVVAWVLKRAGLLKTRQERVRYEKPGCCAVSGKMDITAGCDGNWKKVKEELDKFYEMCKVNDLMDIPFLERQIKISYILLEDLSIKYPEGLQDKIYEVKSLHDRGFWNNKGEMISKPYEHHLYQLTHYLKNNKLGIALSSFLYIDRNTNTMSELPIVLTEDVIAEMDKWIEQMTYYYKNQIVPPKPELIVFDKTKGKFEFNWKVDWSNYKDLILKDVDLKKINDEIDLENRRLKEKKMLLAAVKDEDIYGVKKWKELLLWVKKGEDDEKIIKKFDCLPEMIGYAKSLIDNKEVIKA